MAILTPEQAASLPDEELLSLLLEIYVKAYCYLREVILARMKGDR